MDEPKELSDYKYIIYKEINIFLKKDVINWICDNKLEVLIEGYGKYVLELEE